MKRHFSLLAAACSCVIIFTSSAFSAESRTRKLVVAVKTEPDGLDLSGARSSPLTEPTALNITDKLIDLTTSGELVPGLASWKVSADGKRIDCTLKKGIRFHSGDVFTAKDVEFSFHRGKEKAPTIQRDTRLVERLEIVNDYQVRFHMKSADVTFPRRRFLNIVSRTYYDRVGEEQFRRHPVGTGPYKFVKWEPGQYIELEANEEYWGGAPSIKQVRIVIVREDTTRVAMLKTGEADLIMETPYPMVKDLEKSGFRTAKLPIHPSVSLRFHTLNPDVPWYDKRVRLACAHAIDTKAIVNNLLHGLPDLYPRLAPYELGYDPEIKQYTFDPKKAKELLSEAGYPKGFEMPLYYSVGRAAGVKETLEAVTLYLKAVGISCKVIGLEHVKFGENLRNNWHGNPKAVYAGVDTYPMANYAEPTNALDTSFYSGSSLSVYCNPKFDEVLQKARSTLDDNRRAELIKQGVRIIHEDVASVHLWADVQIYTMKKNVEYTPTKNADYALILIKNVKFRD